jgi:hypothetical protein
MFRALPLVAILALPGCRTGLLDPTDGGASAGARFDLAAMDLPFVCDVTGEATVGSIACGAMSCTGNGATCCVDDTSGAGTCGAAAACPGGFSTFTCDGPEDCPSALCCFTGNVTRGKSDCLKTCGGNVVCHSAADCPKGDRCVQHPAFPPGSGVCKPTC